MHPFQKSDEDAQRRRLPIVNTTPNATENMQNRHSFGPPTSYNARLQPVGWGHANPSQFERTQQPTYPPLEQPSEFNNAVNRLAQPTDAQPQQSGLLDGYGGYSGIPQQHQQQSQFTGYHHHGEPHGNIQLRQTAFGEYDSYNRAQQRVNVSGHMEPQPQFQPFGDHLQPTPYNMIVPFRQPHFGPTRYGSFGAYQGYIPSGHQNALRDLNVSAQQTQNQEQEKELRWRKEDLQREEALRRYKLKQEKNRLREQEWQQKKAELIRQLALQREEQLRGHEQQSSIPTDVSMEPPVHTTQPPPNLSSPPHNPTNLPSHTSSSNDASSNAPTDAPKTPPVT